MKARSVDPILIITVRLPRLNPSFLWLIQVHLIPVFVLVLVFCRARLATKKARTTQSFPSSVTDSALFIYL